MVVLVELEAHPVANDRLARGHLVRGRGRGRGRGRYREIGGRYGQIKGDIGYPFLLDEGKYGEIKGDIGYPFLLDEGVDLAAEALALR